MTDNANLTEEQREVNRLKWLLIEGCARADIPTTTGAVISMAKHVREIMRENEMLLVWMSDYEQRISEVPDNGGAV